MMQVDDDGLMGMVDVCVVKWLTCRRRRRLEMQVQVRDEKRKKGGTINKEPLTTLASQKGKNINFCLPASWNGGVGFVW